MIARVFYLPESQRELRMRIEALLRQYVYNDIQVERSEIDEDYSDSSSLQVQQHAADYLYLLKASMIRDDDFNIQVVHKTGSWSYLGGYDSRARYNMRLPSTLMEFALPAVAIMDRMVMVPQGMDQELQDPLQFPWFFRPLDLQGVLLVDFSDEDSVREATRKVGLSLKSEIARLCTRHMLTRKLPNPDFVELSRLLAVDERYLEQHRSLFVKPPTVRLHPRITSGATRRDRRSRVSLEIHNDSEVTVERLCVQVEAPSDARNTLVKRFLDLAAGERATISFELTPRATPFCPLEVSFLPSEASHGLDLVPVTLWLEVSDPDARATPETSPGH